MIATMSWRSLLLGGWVLASACYKPSFRDCTISCESVNGCPSGLTCDMGLHLCSSIGTCTTMNDAHGDTGSGSATDAAIDGNFSCWPFDVVNFQPCDANFPGAGSAITVAGGTMQIDADDPTCSYANGTVCLRHVADLTVQDHALFVVGHRPLIIVSDGDVLIAGSITYDSVINTQGSSCDASVVQASTGLGGGGGGGGHGTAGATGGAGQNAIVTPGGSLFGMPALEPLQLGCPGAAGGTGSSTQGGTGGFGGGAIQISSKGTVTVNSFGVVTANGGAATGGLGSVGGGAGGGGGGGAAGSVVLEGTTITVGGFVCAVGGGGGQAGNSQNASNGISGSGGQACTPGTGGNPASGPGAGGTGGGTASPVGGQPHNNILAGGGGGGAIGRIRIHTPGTAQLSGSTIVPTAFVQ